MAEFRMPSLGADMERGTLLEWLVKPGDVVHRGDVIAVVDTDKAAIEVECFVDGTVQDLLVTPGAKVPVGAALAEIATAGGPVAPPPETPEAAPAQTAAPTVPLVGQPPVEVAAVPAKPIVTSPLVRRLAKQRGVDLEAVATPGHVVHRTDVEHVGPAVAGRHGHVRSSPRAKKLAAAAGLDLTSVVGTGRDGAITAADVEQAILRRTEAVPSAAPAAEGAAQPTAAPAAGAEREEAMRHAIAALMARSNREIPHYYLTADIDMAAAVEWLHQRNRELSVRDRLVPAALLLKAAGLAAREVGQLNGQWVDDHFEPATDVDLGLVVSLRRGGIIVPVIRDVPSRTVDEIMGLTRDLVQRARTGRLRGSELSPPTITVSNLGDQGVDSVLGVIYPPQVALVGFGSVRERPWAVDGMLTVRPIVTATLAADHRASDGAVGARLLNYIAELLQKPGEL